MFFQRGSRISRRRVFLLTGDILCVAGSIVLAALVRLSPAQGWFYVTEHLPSLGGSALLFLLVFYAGGMYEQQAVRRRMSSFVLPLITVSIGLVLIILVFYARFKLHVGRGILMLAAVFILLSTWALRRLYRMAVGYGLFMKNTLIVGEGTEVNNAVRLVRGSEESSFRVFGVILCCAKKEFDLIEGVPVLGFVDQLREFVDAYSVETVILTTSPARSHELLHVLRPLRYSGVEIMDYVALHEELAQEIPLDYINDEWLMNAAMNSSVVHIRQIKRIMDLLVAVTGLLLSTPLLLASMIAVKISSPGPVFFRQRRVGLEGHVYVLNKLRTMRADAEAGTGAVWAQKNDRRVTRIGQFLRKWRLDELPQLYNVLKGDMSLVGPRPERPEFVSQLAEQIPFYNERQLVPPGITGWAQIKFPYAASVEAAKRKLQYDLYYIKHMSLLLDSLILLRTFKTILVGLRHEEDDPGDEPEALNGNGYPHALSR